MPHQPKAPPASFVASPVLFLRITEMPRMPQPLSFRNQSAWRLNHLGKVMVTILSLLSISSLVQAQDDRVEFDDSNLLLVEPGTRLSPEDIELATKVFFVVTYPQTQSTGQDAAKPVPVTDADLKQLENASHLQTLMINEARVTSKGLGYLSKLPRLEALHFEGMKNTDELLKTTATFPALAKLAIAGSDASNRSASEIAKMSHLKYLDLSSSSIDSDFFLKGQIPPTLTHLHLNEVNVDASILQRLPPGLTHLSLNDTLIGSDAVSEILKMKHLKELEIVSSKLTNEDLLRIKRGLPGTRVNQRVLTKF